MISISCLTFLQGSPTGSEYDPMFKTVPPYQREKGAQQKLMRERREKKNPTFYSQYLYIFLSLTLNTVVDS